MLLISEGQFIPATFPFMQMVCWVHYSSATRSISKISHFLKNPSCILMEKSTQKKRQDTVLNQGPLRSTFYEADTIPSELAGPDQVGLFVYMMSELAGHIYSYVDLETFCSEKESYSLFPINFMSIPVSFF